jgi:hypothetical protein
MTEQGQTRRGRKPLSPEQKARAAENLAKARAARGGGGGSQPWQRDILPIVSGMNGSDAAYLCAGYFLGSGHAKQRSGSTTAQSGTKTTA